MTDEQARCAMCGAPIVRAGEAWAHVGEAQPRHPAVPVGEWPRGKYSHIEIPPDPDALAALRNRLAIMDAISEGRRRELERLEAERARDQALVAAVTDRDLFTALEWFMGETTSLRAMPKAARSAYHAFFALVVAYRAAYRAAAKGEQP